jgi:hypothetical protein
MSDALDLSNMLKDDIPTLDEWLDAQDYEYSRRASEVVDYLNAVIDYTIVDDAIVEYNAGTELVGWNIAFDECGIEEDSEESAVATTHVTSYFEFYSKN